MPASPIAGVQLAGRRVNGYKGAMRNIVRLLLVLLAVSLGGQASARDELRIGIAQYPATMHPNIEAMLAKSYLLGFTQRPITTYDQSWELICLLCIELPTIENGGAVIEPLPEGSEFPEGIAVTYTLQPDATWGDGTPVTTADVLFTWEVGRHAESGVVSGEGYRRILSIDRIDDKTFTIHQDRVDFTYNALNDFGLLPAHLERGVFEDNPREYRHRTLFDTDSTNPGLWFGPYRVAQFTPGAEILLERNPTWWGKPPVFERIRLIAIENTAALEANLLSGSIDMISGELGLALDQAIAFEARHGDRFHVLYKPVLFYEHLEPNFDSPILSELRVRRALMHAIDREAINDQLFGGKQTVALTNVNPLDWMYAEDIMQYPYDPERAAALLDEAGWTPGPDGVRVNAAGERLSFSIMSTAGDRSRELVEQVLQSQWRKVGIDVAIQNQPARVFFGETVQQRLYDGLALFAWLSAPESVPRTTMHSTMIPTEENNWQGQNSSGYRNAEVDALVDAMEVELDREKRGAMWRRLQEIYAEELPALPLWFRSQAFVMPLWLGGIEPTGNQYSTSLWVENWRLLAE
jgi:peptide/nickel transport system substrate-binding protein